jgi:membrane protein YdbS with pleckstrin-like domain
MTWRKSSAAALALGGMSNAVFWLLALRIGTFDATATADPFWPSAQLLHVLAAAALFVGVFGLHAYQLRRLGDAADAAFALLVVGILAYLADGLIALVALQPVLDSAPLLFVILAMLGMLGGVAYAVVTYLRGRAPRSASVLLGLGAILMNLPPGPVPLWVLAVGGELFSAGVLWFAWALAFGSLRGYRGGRARRVRTV